MTTARIRSTLRIPRIPRLHGAATAPEGRYTGPAAESRYVVPRFVERTSQGVREYDPYAKLFEERVIFLGVQIDDASANDVMAQLLCLESMDPDRDISLYINQPRRLLHGAHGHLRHDAVREARHPDGLHGPGGLRRRRAARRRHPRQADGAAERPRPDPPAVQRDRPRPGLRPGDRGQRDPADACRSSRRCWPSTPPRRSRRSATTSSATRSSPPRSRSRTA